MTIIQDNEVRWGILGVGNVCEVKSAPAMNVARNSRLVAVMRRDEEKARDYARRHKVPKWYSNVEALIDDPEVNAIYIATPPHVHKELALKAIAAGKPVYVEKPMARTYQECEEMLAASEAAGVPLHVAYYRRTLPHFVKIKEWIQTGAIGEVRHVRIELNRTFMPDIVGNLDRNWRVDPKIAGGGYFYDLASHQLDFLDFALGPIKTAVGRVANQAGIYAAEDIVTAAFDFECGVMGSGVWCFSTAEVSATDRMVFVGSHGQISVETFGCGKVTLETDAVGTDVLEFDLPAHIQQNLVQAVVDDLLGKGTSPSTGPSAARTNRVLEQICKP